MKKPTIDLNCDMGESFGAYTIGDDASLMRLVTSANIACGWHAGDAATMRRTVRLAIENQVAIGAHPGLPDLAGFGRRRMSLTPNEVYEAVLYQIGALDSFVRAERAALRHVKPHGALYNTAAGNREWADAIAQAVRDFHKSLVLVGLAGSELIKAGQSLGLKTAGEAFADRTYQSDGSLTDRSHADAILNDPEEAADQALEIALHGRVRSQLGTEISLDAATICIHGDAPNALPMATAVANRLRSAGIELRCDY